MCYLNSFVRVFRRTSILKCDIRLVASILHKFGCFLKERLELKLHQFLDSFSQSQEAPITFVVSVGRISIKFYIGNLHENLPKTPNFVTTGQKYRALYMKA
jgi:hypothetical protein